MQSTDCSFLVKKGSFLKNKERDDADLSLKMTGVWEKIKRAL